MKQDSHTPFFLVPSALGVLMAVCVLTGCSTNVANLGPGDSGGSAGNGLGGGGSPSGVGGTGSGLPGGGSSGGAVDTAGQGGGSMAGGATSSGGTGGMNGGAGGMSGAAGAMSGGSAGANGGNGTGGAVPASPSAGCGKASPMTGSADSPLTVAAHEYYVKLPLAYDAMKPYRVLFVFNPTNNPISWAEQNAGFEKNAAKDEAIRVYPAPASVASGWVAGDVSFFRPLYDQIVASFCADKARVFAGGESSGGDFSSILGCEYASLLRGVAPCATKDVSEYPLEATKRNCTGEVSSIVIQGKNDMVVGPANGPKTRDFYAALNHCGTMSEPVPGYTDSLSNCVQYSGCDAGYPVYWCQHSDPNYNNTNHGWPNFAANMIWSVFSAY